MAKPIYCLTLIDFANNNSENKISWGDKAISNYYNKMFQDLGISKTPLWKPFYYLSSEPFYSLVWKDAVLPPSNSVTPSAKFLRENLLYAKLDDELWELLQEEENREYLKDAIINQYLKN